MTVIICKRCGQLFTPRPSGTTAKYCFACRLPHQREYRRRQARRQREQRKRIREGLAW